MRAMRATRASVGVLFVAIAACGADDQAVPAAPTAASAAPSTTAPVLTAPSTLPAPPVTTLPPTMPNDPSPTPAPTTSVGAAPPAGPAGIEATWQLVSGAVGGAQVPLLETAQITLVIGAGEVGGVAACNSYSGFAEVTGTTIAFLGLLGTAMACDGPIMQLEQTYLGSIRAPGQPPFDYVVDGSTLTLSAPDATWVFERVPEADLVGTTWILSEQVASAVTHTSGMEAGWLRLDPDGTVAGSTSCREFTASWTTDGDGVRFDGLTPSDECSGSLADIDADVLRVLGGAVSVQLALDHLVLSTADGTGLGFHAD